MNEKIGFADDSDVAFLVASLANTKDNDISIFIELPFWWVPPVVFLKYINFVFLKSITTLFFDSGT